MLTFLFACFISSLCIVTVWRLFNDDASFISHWRYLMHHWPEYIKKPLYDCMFCMSSIWGATWFTAFNFLFELHFGTLHTLTAVFVIAGFVSLLQGAMHILDWLLSLVRMLDKKPEEDGGRDASSEEVRL